MINMTKSACEICTTKQLRELAHMHGDRPILIFVQKAGFELPNGYLSFRLKYDPNNSIYGGIAPDGSVST